MDNNRRKIIVILLVVSTVLVGVIAIVLGQLIQGNQSPNSASAFGFGEAVNKQYFDTFEQKFANIGCFGILSNSVVNAYTNEGTTILDAYDLQIINKNPIDKNPVSCTIKLDAKKSIDLSIFTYKTTSAIDPDASSLFARINSNILRTEYQGDLNTGYFFYGADSLDPASCRMNFFNTRNDFEYITLKVSGFTESCKDQMLLSGELSYYLNKSVNNLIDQIVTNLRDDSKGN